MTIPTVRRLQAFVLEPQNTNQHPDENLCGRLLRYEAAVTKAFDDFLNSKAEAENPSWWRDSTPTKDDWGKAFVGGVIGAMVFRNAGGAAIGVGISIAGNTLYTEAQNIIDPRLHADYMKFQNDYKVFNEKAQEAYKAMNVTTAEHKTWVAFRKNGGNCGGSGGSWLRGDN